MIRINIIITMALRLALIALYFLSICGSFYSNRIEEIEDQLKELMLHNRTIKKQRWVFALKALSVNCSYVMSTVLSHPLTYQHFHSFIT